MRSGLTNAVISSARIQLVFLTYWITDVGALHESGA